MTLERPVEVELKYSVQSVAAGRRLINGDVLGSLRADGRARSSRSVDRYVDTPDGALARAGFAARLRRERARTIVSIKSLGLAAGALQRRTEIEGPADDTLTPGTWPHSPARSLILELCGDTPLVELVTIRQLRRKRRFRDDQTIVEASLDAADVIAGSQLVDQFVELEVELVEGPEAPLMALRTALDAGPGLSPSTSSKFERAIAATQIERSPGGGTRAERGRRRAGPSNGAGPAPDAGAAAAQKRGRVAPPPAADDAGGLVVGRTPGVTADDIVAEAGRKVLRFHLARLIAREAGTRLGEDSEELHAMRVATRRMRAAWRVFGDGFRPDGTRRFRNRLRDLAAKLGAVRDIDVLILALEEYRRGLPDGERPALEPLLDDWRAEREAGRVVLTRELDSDGYRRFVDDYRSFVLTPGAGALVVSATEPHHVRDTAGSHIWHAYETVLAYGPVLRWADVPTLHQLRIAAKWLRYTLEFVSEAIGPGGKPLIERVVAMQDHLGLMNDAEVAAIKARALLVARTGTLSDAETGAIARYLTSREREVARLKRGAAATWRRLASPAFRRGLGRAVATLAASPGGVTRR